MGCPLSHLETFGLVGSFQKATKLLLLSIYLLLPFKYYLFQILKNGTNKFCDRYSTEVSDDAEDENDEEIRRLQMEIKRQRNEKKMRKERQRLELQSDGLTDTAGSRDQSASPGLL